MRSLTRRSRLRHIPTLALVVAACAGSSEFQMVARRSGLVGTEAALPARWEAGLIRVDALIGEDTAAILLLDTGASSFVLSPDTIERGGLRMRSAPSQEGGLPVSDAHGARVLAERIARIDRVRCGALELRDVDALVRDLSGFERVAGVRIDGILPATAFLQLLLTIDLPGQSVEVRPATPDALIGADGLELADSGVPRAVLDVAGRSVPLLIDTGSLGRISLPASLEPVLELVAPAVETGRALGLSGAEPRRHARLAGDLSIAGHVLRRPIVELTSADRASAGLGLLRQFRTTLDLEGRRIRLERPSSAPIETESMRGIGCGFVRHEAVWEVAYVVESGPAAGVGLRVGDTVSHVAGTPVSELRSTRIEALLAGRDELVVRLVNGPASRDVTVPITVLVD